jgi:hypothetical protein
MRTLLLLLALVPTAASADVTVYASGGQSGKTRHGQATVSALHIELGRALSPRAEVAFVLAPMNFDQPLSWFGEQFGEGNEDVRALSGSLLIRYKFNVDSPRVQFYGEAGTGPMYAEKAVPASTSRFNFVSQFGAGVVLMPRARFPLIAGYRFLHISNGGYSPRNPGLNISSVILGVRWRH